VGVKLFYALKLLQGFEPGQSYKNLILPINNRHHAHIIATHIEAKGIGFSGGDFATSIAGTKPLLTNL